MNRLQSVRVERGQCQHVTAATATSVASPDSELVGEVQVQGRPYGPGLGDRGAGQWIGVQGNGLPLRKAWLLIDQGLGGRHWTRTSDLLHVKQVL